MREVSPGRSQTMVPPEKVRGQPWSTRGRGHRKRVSTVKAEKAPR